jgi:hypothetical protein
MRKETDAWLSPLVLAAEERGIDTEALRSQAFPAEGSPAVRDLFSERVKESESEVRVLTLDWVRFGQLLREALGWENSYPAVPKFPESRP